MSLAGGETRCRVFAHDEGDGNGGPCMLKFKASWVMVTWDLPCEQTDMTENITSSGIISRNL